MSKRLILIGGALVVAAVALYLSAEAAPVAPPGMVVVTMEIKYKSNGEFKKVKVRSSNGPWWKRSLGKICYDETGACQAQGEDWELTWTALNLAADESLEILAKTPHGPNWAIFESQTLDHANPTKNVGAPIPPVHKKNNGKYYEFEYDIKVFKKGIEIGIEDPDVMPHGPGG